MGDIHAKNILRIPLSETPWDERRLSVDYITFNKTITFYIESREKSSDPLARRPRLFSAITKDGWVTSRNDFHVNLEDFMIIVKALSRARKLINIL